MFMYCYVLDGSDHVNPPHAYFQNKKKSRENTNYYMLRHWQPDQPPNAQKTTNSIIILIIGILSACPRLVSSKTRSLNSQQIDQALPSWTYALLCRILLLFLAWIIQPQKWSNTSFSPRGNSAKYKQTLFII